MKQTVSVVITDLDNTLFDWVDIWFRSFKAMLDRLVVDSGISEEILLGEFKAIHQKHKTSEYAFSIEELPSLQARFPGEELPKKFESAIKAYRFARNDALRLYEVVFETLEFLKDRGCLLVGYTDSLSFYTKMRLKKLGLDRIFDYVYSPPDHELPEGKTAKEIRFFSEEHYLLRRTVERPIPKDEHKPNPKVLLDILRDIGASRDEAVYVGDNLMKDVLMAQKAGVTDVWAKYGTAHQREEYELLRKVSHWSEDDIEREKRLKAEHVSPTWTLEASLGELIGKFNFVPFQDKSESRKANAVELWKTTVEVQRHFNDLELRIRNYAVTVLAAVLGLAAYSLKENLQISLYGARFPLASATLLLAILPWLAFYFMDRFWYHRHLYGAIDHGMLIENRWKRLLPEIALTDAIGKRSPIMFWGKLRHSTWKMDLFYLTIAGLLLALGVASMYAVGTASVVPPQATAARPVVQNPPSPIGGPVGVAALPKDIDPVSQFRLPSVKRDDLDDAGKKVYDRFANPSDPGAVIRGPNGVRLYSPVIADHLYTVNQYLRNEAGFGNRIAELAILTAAREANSQYEWGAHEGAAQRAGVEQEIIDIVKYRKDLKGLETTKGLGEKEALIIRLSREMLRDKSVTSATFAEGLRLFDRKGLVELVSLIAHYTATGYLLNTFGNVPSATPNSPMPIP